MDGNPVAGAMVEWVEVLLDNDNELLVSAAAAFDTIGCRYQLARTLVLTSGDHAARGAAALSNLGLPDGSAPVTPHRRFMRASATCWVSLVGSCGRSDMPDSIPWPA